MRRINDDRENLARGGPDRGRCRVEGFAGLDIEKAVFYPEDDQFLIERDLTVCHYEVADTE
jgi:hypothetical protein